MISMCRQVLSNESVNERSLRDIITQANATAKEKKITSRFYVGLTY